MEFKIQLDPKALEFKEKNPELLREARKRAVEAAGMVWADETKKVTMEDDHIDTSLYINSIGYVTNYPEHNHTGKGKRHATQEDVVYELEETSDSTTLSIGSNVSYAAVLEKRYNLMARGLDRARPRMQTVADFQIKKTLNL